MNEPAKRKQRPRPGPKPVEPANETAPAPAPQAPRGPSARDLRKKRARQLGVRMAIAVGVPTLLAAVYFGFVDTREYQSVTSFTIQSADSGGPAMLDGLLASVSGGSATHDVRMVKSYIESRDMLRLLTEEHGFVEHFSQPDTDWLSRLPKDAPFEDRYDYYQDRVQAEFATESGTVKVSVRAFDPDKAREFAQAILTASESMVNRMMTEARQDRLRMARREVEKAEERLTGAREKIRKLQKDRAELNPQAEAEATLGVKSSLEAQLAEARAELSTLRATLQPGAPQLVAQQQRVSALQRQVRGQERRLASQDDEGLHADIAAFEPVMAEKELAMRGYESAIKSLELARLEADRQHRYLVTIARPSKPDAPTHPRVILAILTAFVLSLVLFAIGSLIVASVREHANV